MRILVDADACPVKNIIIRVGREKDIDVVMFMDTSHAWDNKDEAKIITVDKSRDGVDIALINMTNKDDIVVTQDYGLAALVLGKGARALNQNGMVFSSNNMDKLLFERHLGQKVRRAGGRTKGIRKRPCQDDEKFEKILRQLLEQA